MLSSASTRKAKSTTLTSMSSFVLPQSHSLTDKELYKNMEAEELLKRISDVSLHISSSSKGTGSLFFSRTTLLQSVVSSVVLVDLLKDIF